MRKIEKGERGSSESQGAHVENGKKPRLKKARVRLQTPPAPSFTARAGMVLQSGDPHRCPALLFLGTSQSLPTAQ